MSDKRVTPLGTIVGIVLLLCLAALAIMLTLKAGMVLFG